MYYSLGRSYGRPRRPCCVTCPRLTAVLERYEELARRRNWPSGARDGLWEAVLVGGEVTAVKQMEVPEGGGTTRYCWSWLEDDAGFLTDQPLKPDEEELTQI